MEETHNSKLSLGIAFMIISSICTCSGQLFWKLAASSNYSLLYYAFGFTLYGCGALLMITAFKFGELSVLHPMLSIGYILSLFLGSIFLKEIITLKSIIGVSCIFIGMIFLSMRTKGEKHDSFN